MSLHPRYRQLTLGLVVAYVPAAFAHHEAASAINAQAVLLVSVMAIVAFVVWRVRDRS